MHLLPRVVQRLGHSIESFHEDDWLNLSLQGQRLYAHQLLYINYTTYDVRRNQDIIHVNTPQSNVLLLNEEFFKEPLSSSLHPYLYAKVLGVYHVNVSYLGDLPDGTQDLTPHRFDLAWIHWYELLDPEEEWEVEPEFTMDRLGFQSLDSDGALDFVDPADIVRAVHLIPHFANGHLDPVEIPRSKRFPAQGPWKAYYINK